MAEGNLRINRLLVDPSVPNVGDTVTITAECENVGDADVVMGRIVQNTNRIFDDCYKGSSTDCEDLPGSGDWNFQGSFTMPDRDVIIIATTYHRYAYVLWSKDDEKTITLNPGQAVCTGATITPNKTTTNKCDTVKFTLKRNPDSIDKGHLIEVISGEYYDRGSATTDSSGKCEINYLIRTPGAHVFYAKFESGCYSGNTTINITDAGDLCEQNCEWWDVTCSIQNWFGDNWLWIAIILLIIVLLLVYLLISKFM